MLKSKNVLDSQSGDGGGGVIVIHGVVSEVLISVQWSSLQVAVGRLRCSWSFMMTVIEWHGFIFTTDKPGPDKVLQEVTTR